MKKRTVIILCLGVVVPIALVVGALIWGASAWPEEVTNPAQFQTILGSLGQNVSPGAAKGLAYFPTAIPAAATNPRFYYLPHFLQGGTRLQLRYGLPHARIQSLAGQYAAISKQTTQGSAHTFAAVHGQQGLPTAEFRNAANTQFAALPTDFAVYVLDASGFPSFNHGYSYGAAISLQRDEVIYWLEDW